jgi:cytoskeletal protein CcmA (bactofilin family)
MALKIIITNAGRAALVNAANTGTAAVTIAQIGITATAVTPSNTATSLPNEIKRIAALSGDVVADDIIHLIVRDESTSVFTVRSFALYLADGTLFAIYGQTNPILEKSAQAMMLLAIDVQFADIDAAQLTFGNANFLNPPATTEIQGVVELATEDETATGVDTQRAVTPKTLKSAVTKWIDTRFGEGAPSAFVKTLLTAASAVAMRTSLGIKSAALKDEGAGNNLDADLLDGQHGPYYADVPARLGYTPLNKAGDTVTGSLGVIGDLTLSNTGPIGYFNRPNVVGSKRITINTKGGTNLEAFDVYSDLIRFNGSTAWHSGNDGAGSGLDADLLAGQAASYYTNIVARLGYTPLNKAGDTIGGNLGVAGDLTLSSTAATAYINRPNVAGSKRIAFAVQGGSNLEAFDIYSNIIRFNGGTAWHSGNDGAGSGLDADLLAGQAASYYTNVVARLGYTPLNKAGDTVGGNLAVAGNLAVTGELTLSSTGTTAYMNRPNVVGSKRMAFAVQGGGNLEAFDVFSDLIRFNGGTAWHSGNDGAGSGLDADLLAGQAANYYTNIVARLGYTPLNKAGDTVGGNLAVAGNLAVTGELTLSSTGTTAYMNRPNVVGSKRISFAVQGGGALEAFDISSELIRFNGSTAWHAGNDGSGSGMDADLLDGLQGIDYAKVADFVRLASANGYQKLPNGMILQWGKVTSSGTFSFPMAFPTACLQIVAGNSDAQGTYSDNAFAYPVTAATFYAGAKSAVNSNSLTSYGVSYIAIGY